MASLRVNRRTDPAGWWNIGSDNINCYDKLKYAVAGDVFPLTFTNGVATLSNIPSLGGVRPRSVICCLGFFASFLSLFVLFLVYRRHSQ